MKSPYKDSERYKQIEKLVAEGKSFADITRATGADWKTIKKHFPQAGKGVGSNGGLTLDKLDPEKFATMGRMVADGASLNEIMRTLHCDRRTIKRSFPNAGWERGGAGKAAAVKKARKMINELELK